MAGTLVENYGTKDVSKNACKNGKECSIHACYGDKEQGDEFYCHEDGQWGAIDSEYCQQEKLCGRHVSNRCAKKRAHQSHGLMLITCYNIYLIKLK